MMSIKATTPGRFRGAMLRYVTAVLLSFGAATAFIPAGEPRTRYPIVRQDRQPLVGGFDRREADWVAGQFMVVTVEECHAEAPARSQVFTN